MRPQTQEEIVVNIALNFINTEHRAGRMLEALIASENSRAKMLLTADLKGEDGSTRLHQTFAIKRWVGRDGNVMLTLEVEGSGDWNAGTRAIKMFHVDAGGGRILPARDPRNEDRLLQYAAQCALVYAWNGSEALPTPANGTVEVVESDNCGMCGRVLSDPVSIERGIGPECFGRATGGRTITGRGRATAAA
jgi:hypothetical protein